MTNIFELAEEVEKIVKEGYTPNISYLEYVNQMSQGSLRNLLNNKSKNVCVKETDTGEYFAYLVAYPAGGGSTQSKPLPDNPAKFISDPFSIELSPFQSAIAKIALEKPVNEVEGKILRDLKRAGLSNYDPSEEFTRKLKEFQLDRRYGKSLLADGIILYKLTEAVRNNPSDILLIVQNTTVQARHDPIIDRFKQCCTKYLPSIPKASFELKGYSKVKHKIGQSTFTTVKADKNELQGNYHLAVINGVTDRKGEFYNILAEKVSGPVVSLFSSPPQGKRLEIQAPAEFLADYEQHAAWLCNKREEVKKELDTDVY
ncbi:MAG: hypothetical protein ABEJ25_03065 [Candidatus Bipolaricaulia bacterium]